ncbi:arsenate reductase family protein [Halobacillus fulvus]|nr:arsenate reductase family protein [Halobacillus fulvus]
MSLTFYWYPNCGTCKKAKKWFDENGVDYQAVHIVEQTPTEAELKTIVEDSGLPTRKFFNTSGKKYRELNMKEKLKDASDEQMIQWLASDGMLVKRPIVTDGDRVTVGFKQDQFEENWLK